MNTSEEFAVLLMLVRGLCTEIEALGGMTMKHRTDALRQTAAEMEQTVFAKLIVQTADILDHSSPVYVGLTVIQGGRSD